MEKNCKVTQYKKATMNDELPIFNSIVLEIQEVVTPTDASQWFNIIDTGEGPITAEIIGDGHFIRGYHYEDGTNIGKIIENVTNTNIAPFYYLSNGNYKILITGKYNINIVCPTSSIKIIDLDELQYNNISNFLDRNGAIKGDIKIFRNINSLKFKINNSRYGVYGKLTDIMTPTRTELSIYDANSGKAPLKGNLSSVLISKDTLTIFDIGGNAGITGNINVLGQCTNLTELYCFNGCSTYGTIESLIAAFRSNGKESGTLKTQVYDKFGTCAVTFNGQALPITYATTVLSWTTATITCNGVTIEA